MSSSFDQLKFFGAMLLGQLPVLIACLIGLGLVLARWKSGAPGLVWALAGFGLALILCIAVPIGQLMIQSWLRSAGDMSARSTLFSLISIFWSTLRGISYALLAMAVYVNSRSFRRSSP